MSSGPRRPAGGESTSAAVSGSDVSSVSQRGHSARRGNNGSSTGPLPVHIEHGAGGGAEKYDWRASPHNRNTSGAAASETDRRVVGQPPHVTPPSPTARSPPHSPTPLSPTSRHHPLPPSIAHSATGPLPSRFDGPGSQPYSRPGKMDLTNKSTLTVGSAMPPRSLDSPTYSSGDMSSGELRAEIHQASSMGSRAKVLSGNSSFPFDREQLKPIPKGFGIQAKTSAPSADILAATGGNKGNVGGAEAPGGGIGESRTETCARTEGYSGSKTTPKLSGGEGRSLSRSYSGGKDPGRSGGDGSGDESQGYSTQSSVGGYSTQESGGHSDDGCKILLRDSIPLGAAKRIRRESELSSKLDPGSVAGVGPSEGGDGEGVDAVGEGETVKRPFEKQVSTGKGDHMFCCLGRGASRMADSLGGLKPGNGGAESADISGRAINSLLSKKNDEIRELKRQLAQRDEMLRKKEERGAAQDLRSQQEEYDESRHKTTELQRLRSVEEHEKRLQLELSSCKEERNVLEGQVVQLAQELSLGEQRVKELKVKCAQLSEGTRLSAEGEGSELLYEENRKLKEEVASLKRDVERKESNVRKMKDRVKNLTQQVTLGDGPGSLEVEGMAGSEVEEGQKQSHLLHASSSGGGSGDVEISSLRLEKDQLRQQLSSEQNRFEGMARNMTALVEARVQSSVTIKSLSEKCTKLQEENAQLLADRDKMTSSITELSSVSEGLKVEAEELRREKEIFDSSSELEEANKQVQLLHDQLEEQERVMQRQIRELKARDEKLMKSADSVNSLQQELVLQGGLAQNLQQNLINSQQVASDLSSKCEQQAIELDQLRKAKEDLIGELQAQKFVSAGYQEDFNEERKDREKAHSKMADMEMQYKHQFNKLGEELMVSRQHCEQLERRLKEVESYYQAQLSQTKYSTGDRDKAISKLQAENKRLEEDLASKMQQVKQYKKQADHHVMELSSFRDAHDIQKTQIQNMGMEADRMRKEIDILKRDNTNLKARERHYEVTGKAGGGGRSGRTGATLEVEKKRIHELEGSVEELQVTNAILQSKVEQYQKHQVQPSHSQATPISSSSSRDRVGQQNFSAPPSRPPQLVIQGKASSVDSMSNSRSRQDQSYNTPTYSDYSNQLPSLKGGGGPSQHRSHTSYAPSQYSSTGRATQPTSDPYSNARLGTNAVPPSTHPSYYTASNADLQSVSSASNAGLHGVGVALPPNHQYQYNVGGGGGVPYGSGGRPSSSAAGTYSGGGNGNLISRNYGQSGSSGPTSLPGLLSPDHKSDPLRGPHGQGARHSRDDMELETVEKDSPPSSFLSPGPSSLDVAQQPRNQLPQSRGQSAGGVVNVGQDREAHAFMMRQNLGQVGSRVGPITSAGYRPPASSNNGSRMRPSTSAGSGIGYAPTQPGARGQDLAANYPKKYPLQETTASSSHAPPLRPNTQAKSETSLSGNRLETGIDGEIVSAADDVKTQVGGEGVGQEDAPYDPNLVCPTCGQGFRIGQIQLFRQHAASCNNKRV